VAFVAADALRSRAGGPRIITDAAVVRQRTEVRGQLMIAPHLPNIMRSTALGYFALIAISVPHAFAQSQAVAAEKASVIARGAYLAQAGDCVACHTAPGGKLFAGGHAMSTPFGTLYTSNVTPDRDTGIGKWNADQFYSMMHTGRSPDGGLLYPAMPFGSYTKITRADSDAIFAFMQSVPPVKQANKPHDLKFPYNNRSLIIGWRTLFFTEGEYQPDTTKSDEWNRGAYLVQGLGHCAMCHSAINALGGSSESAAFEGGLIPMQNWYAPSLTSSKEGGLGDWSIEDISDLLRIGISKRGAVYGPMADVTFNSLQYMTEADTRAMAVYLKSLAEHSVPDAPRATTSAQESSLLLRLGLTIYADKCATCHGEKGLGKPPHYPPLAGNQSIEMSSAVNPIRMVLNGGYPPGTAGNPMPYGMPPFAQSLSDDEVAAVVTYIRVSWGNHGAAVSAAEANALRSAPLQ
jgi:mono/diheme cytochrome c family protein